MIRPLALALCLAPLLPACANVCDRKCLSEADLFERCLPTWNTTWVEQGFADRNAFLDRCYAVWGDAWETTERGSVERETLGQECTTQLQRAEADTDCETLAD